MVWSSYRSVAPHGHFGLLHSGQMLTVRPFVVHPHSGHLLFMLLPICSRLVCPLVGVSYNMCDIIRILVCRGVLSSRGSGFLRVCCSLYMLVSCAFYLLSVFVAPSRRRDFCVRGTVFFGEGAAEPPALEAIALFDEIVHCVRIVNYDTKKRSE